MSPQLDSEATPEPGTSPPSLHLRPALMSDADAIFRLIDEASKNSTVLPRSRDSVYENLRDYLVAEADDGLAACGALHIWSLDLAEIRSLVVHPSRRGLRVGSRVVQGLIDEARRLRLHRLFVLTDSVEFFVRQGFQETDRGTLPHKVWNECILCPKFEDCGEVSLDMRI